MPYYLSPIGNSPQTSTSGAPLTAGTIGTFLPGTSTPVATYTDNTGGTPQTNPIVLNTYGLPSSPIWLLGGQAAKFVIKDAVGNLIRTIDSVTGIPLPNGQLIGVRVFTTSTIYVPTQGTSSIVAEVLGGGGGGGGATATGGAQISGGAGGNSGAYGKSRITSSFSGATVTVGAGGAGGAIGATGGSGTASNFMGVNAPGGLGGTCAGAITPPAVSIPQGNLSAMATGANIINTASQVAGAGLLFSTGSAFSGCGGSSPLGAAPQGTPSGAGLAATGYGCGGSGAISPVSSAGFLGGAGGPGVVIVYEYA